MVSYRYFTGIISVSLSSSSVHSQGIVLASTDIGAPFLNKIITITAGSKFFIPRDKSHRCNKGTKSIVGKLNHMYMILSNGISHIKHMVSRIFFLNIGIFSVLYVLIIIIVIYLGAWRYINAINRYICLFYIDLTFYLHVKNMFVIYCSEKAT